MATRDVAARFSSWLRERNLPVTAQRMAIAEILLASERHLSAEEVAQELGLRGAKVGTATVYRTLDALVESGLVVERDLGEGFRRFEPARDEPVRDFLRCTSCGRTQEFHDESIVVVSERVAAHQGFERESQRLVILGVCRDCRVPGEGIPS